MITYYKYKYILFNMNDTIHNSSRYYDNCFNKHRKMFSMLNANIRGIATDLNTLKFPLDDMYNSFPILGLSEMWLKFHNVDFFS